MKISLSCLLVIILTAGCQRAPQPVAYHGRVTLDGRPIDTGRIQFVVQGEPPAGTEIVDGRFTGEAQPGPKRVEIFAFRPVEPDPNDPVQLSGLPNPVENVENYVPEQYNSDSDLVAEITTSGPNEFEFALSSTSPAVP